MVEPSVAMAREPLFPLSKSKSLALCRTGFINRFSALLCIVIAFAASV